MATRDIFIHHNRIWIKYLVINAKGNFRFDNLFKNPLEYILNIPMLKNVYYHIFVALLQ